MKTRQAPVQGPCGAPFRPGDRFRWTSGNGLTVRTGTIIEWQEHVSERMQELYGWGSWFVQVDPLPKPRGARLCKNNPWDGFRTWFGPQNLDQLERMA